MTTETKTLWLNPSAIEPNPFNPRRTFSEQEILELAASIKEQGLLQPILVRPIRGKKGITHQIVLGERRWRAVCLLELSEVEVRCRQMSDFESSKAALTENIQRQDLTDYEEANGLLVVQQQAEKAGKRLGVRDLQMMFGKSETYIRNRLDLFKLKPEVQAMTQRHRLVLTSAYKINKVPDAEARQELIKLVDGGASVKAVESKIEQLQADQQWKRDSQRPPDSTTRSALSEQQKRLSEAEKQVKAALDEAERCLLNAGVWKNHLPSRIMKSSYSEQVARIRRHIEGLET